jgi:hypothetical protein
VPLCWCESWYERIPFIVSDREECRRLEERFVSEAPELAACYYEDHAAQAF